MRFSVLLRPGLNLPYKRVAKSEDLGAAIAAAGKVRTDTTTQAVQVWENWPPRGKEKCRWFIAHGKTEGIQVDK